MFRSIPYRTITTSATTINRAVHTHKGVLLSASPLIQSQPSVVSPLLLSRRSFHPSMSTPLANVATPSEDGGPVQRLIHQKLTTQLQPTFLSILNESHLHSGPPGRESHFKVTIVSSKFDSLNILARHRTVNTILADELKHAIHALSITARTPAQWEADQTVQKSPACLGGQKTNKQRPAHTTPDK